MSPQKILIMVVKAWTVYSTEALRANWREHFTRTRFNINKAVRLRFRPDATTRELLWEWGVRVAWPSRPKHYVIHKTGSTWHISTLGYRAIRPKAICKKSSGTRTCVLEIMHADNLCTKFALSAGFCFQLRLDETKMTDDGQTTHNP